MVQTAQCRCGAVGSRIGADGVCRACGAKQVKKPSPPPRKVLQRDHLEHVIGPHFASVTDRGKVHEDNQDAVVIVENRVGSDRYSVIVVCDGVSSSQHAAAASQTAAQETAQSLVRLLNGRVDSQDAVRLSIVVADLALHKIPYDPRHPKLHPPGTTVVAAVLMKGRLTVGWVGDSRCYWIDDTGAKLLTHDHSWVNLMVDAGKISADKAVKRREAHGISRALGPIITETKKKTPASVARITIRKPGRILVCSDGLWNYLVESEALTTLIPSATGPADALSIARSLVDFANSKGGKDNITAAVLSAG